jgi:chemotaxis methyl-accepting protein methylase
MERDLADKTPDDTLSAINAITDTPGGNLTIPPEYRDFESCYTVLDGIFVPTFNDFFRCDNVNGAILARTIAPAIVAGLPRGEIFRQADIGCSEAKDTWSMAAALAMQGICFQIEAYDINPHVIELAQQPYRETKRELERKLINWELPRACLDFFETVGPEHLRPTEVLRNSVTFHELDIRNMPLETGRFDVVVANNILCHYKWSKDLPAQAKILRNMICGLRSEGVFSTNNYDLSSNENKAIYRRLGLTPATDLCEDPIAFFRHLPGKRTFGVKAKDYPSSIEGLYKRIMRNSLNDLG